MKVSLLRSFSWIVGVIGGLLVEIWPNALLAQVVGSNSSFSDKFELADSKSVVAYAVSDTEALLKQNLILQEQVKSISETLVKTSQDADAAQTENRELKTRVEALGLNAVGNDRSKLEQRLIRAVSDLNIAQRQVTEYRKIFASLTESVLALLKTSEGISPESRLAVEVELRNANQKLEGETEFAEKALPTAPSLTNARVISLKPELGLVVGNVGNRAGVKVGMPFRVFEGQKAIALARVVDVREDICGALIQENLSEQTSVKVGHRLKVAAE